MNANWAIVYFSTSLHKITLVKSLLEGSEIDAIILNKQNSVYPSLNFEVNIELFVHSDNVIKAKHLIKKNQL
ncbi:MAG: hypothetical protein COA57_14525 [Flavobacteriales bacterium]|nr:MAG: hypothetical protein COA57_14525 [Flavobacteriales bacterium]